MAGYNPDQTAREVIADYLKYRLEHEHFHWDSGRGDNVEPSRYDLAMRKLGDEFEGRFKRHFDTMIHQLPFNPGNASERFHLIMEDVISEEPSWGRMVALYVFAGRFAVECYEKNMPELVDHLVDWVDEFMTNKFQAWMDANNGWEGFVEFEARGPHNRGESPLDKIAKYAAAGIGLLTLGAILTNRI